MAKVNSNKVVENTGNELVDGKLKAAPIDWASIEGDVYGGQSPIIDIDAGDAAGPFVYTGKSTIATQQGTAVSHTATYEENQVRLPLSATFLKAMDQAGVSHGDTFYIKRDADVIGKTGRAKGQTLQVYAIKVTDRSEVVVQA